MRGIMGSQSRSFSEKGLTLVEAMIGAGILAFTISVGSYLIVQSHKSSNNLVGSSLCKVRAETLIQNFANNANKTNISNWVYSGTTLYPSGAPWVLHPELGFVAGGLPSNIVPSLANPVTAATTNGWELIDASTNWALYLATTYPNFCNVSSAEVGPGNFGQAVGGVGVAPFPTVAPSFASRGLAAPSPPPGSSFLNNEIDYLNIRMINNAGVYGCPGKISGGFTFPTTLVPNGSNLPFEIVGSITYNNRNDPPNTAPHYCQASTKIKLDADTSPPKFIDPRIVPNSLVPAGAACGTGAPNLMCAAFSGPLASPNPTPVACNPTIAGGVSLIFQVNEPGSVFGCALNYSATTPFSNAPPAAFQLCGTGTTIAGVPVSMAVTPYGNVAGSYLYGSGESIAITGAGKPLPEGFYQLWIRAFDSAQNPQDQYFNFFVSQTNPGVNVIPPNPQIAGFNAFALPTRNHLPVPTPWNTAFTFPGQLFQCSDTVAGDYWTLTGAGSPPPALPPTAVWSYTTASTGVTTALSGGSCAPKVLTPGGLPDGNYTMNAIPCSSCGAPVPSAAPAVVPWVVDRTAGPTPAHSPTGTPASNFSTFPSWTFSIPKPAPLPYEYSCQNVSPATYSTVSAPAPAACSPTGFPSTAAAPNPDPCSAQGSLGFCSMAVDGCGNLYADVNTPYQILAATGQSCCNVPCQAGLICAMDNSIYRGTCVAPSGSCTADANCATGGGTCYLAQGSCYGAGPGPAPQTCAAATPTPTPGPTATPIPPPPTPVPTATPATTPFPSPTPVPIYACTCPGAPGVCNGQDMSATGPAPTVCQFDIYYSCTLCLSGSCSQSGQIASCN